MDKPVPLDQFLDETTAAKVDTLLPTAEAAVKASGRDVGGSPRDFAAYQIERMRDFILDLYRGTSSSRTFVDTAGGAVDCIPYEQQPTAQAAVKHGHVLRKPPAKSPAAGTNTPLGPGKADPFGTPKECPDGTVPWKRITLAGLAKLGTLDSFFGRRDGGDDTVAEDRPGGKGFKDPTGFYHRHATVETAGAFYGCEGWFNLWAPNPTPGVFSLGQLWLVRDRGGWGSGVQTIESGWQVYPSHPNAGGSGWPYLFVFFNPDNYGPRSGYLVNKFGEGFIYYPNATWTIGSPLDPALVTQGEDANNQHGLMMRWVAYDDGDWELQLGLSEDELSPVGHFPGGLYGALRPFEKLQFGGEVSSQLQQTATGRMGSGHRPTGSTGSDFGRVAFIKNLAAQPVLGLPFENVTDFRVMLPDQDAGYSCTLSTGEKWGTYIFFGGPNE